MNLLIAVSGFILSLLITKWLVRFLPRKGLIDKPNERSSHANPTPRGAGLAIIVVFYLGALVLHFLWKVNLFGLYFWIGLTLIAVTSLLDDKFTLPVALRLLIQIIACVLVLLEVDPLDKLPIPDPFSFVLGVFKYPLSLLWMLGVMNIYNFLDGADGYAASQSVVASLGIALIDSNGPGLYVGILIACSSLGFLIYNWYPAKVFMGDIGSISIGFIFGAIPFYFDSLNSQYGIFTITIFLWFFLADGVLTILRRVYRRQTLWEPHRDHIYQNLIDSGIKQGHLVLTVMSISCLMNLIYCIVFYFDRRYTILILILAILLLIYYLWFSLNRGSRFNKIKQSKIYEVY